MIGVDVDAEKVRQINAGAAILTMSSDARPPARRRIGKLYAPVSCYDDLREVDAISICVPTPLRKTRDPDMSYIIQAAQSIAEIRRPGMLIVLESTTYPGNN